MHHGSVQKKRMMAGNSVVTTLSYGTEAKMTMLCSAEGAGSYGGNNTTQGRLARDGSG